MRNRTIILILILINSIYIAKAQETNLVVELPKMNTFYIGVPNPLKISMTSSENLNVYIKEKNGEIEHLNDNEYNVTVTQTGKVTLVVEDSNRKLITEKKYHVKRIPDPIVKIDGKHESGFYSFNQLNSFENLQLINNSGYDAPFKIESFYVSATINGFEEGYRSKSEKITNAMRFSLFKKIKPGTRIFFEDIVVSSPDGSLRKLGIILIRTGPYVEILYNPQLNYDKDFRLNTTGGTVNIWDEGKFYKLVISPEEDRKKFQVSSFLLTTKIGKQKYVLKSNSSKFTDEMNEVLKHKSIHTVTLSQIIVTNDKEEFQVKGINFIKNYHNTPPEIFILEPSKSDRNVTSKKITIRGKVTDTDGVKKVLINTKEAFLKSDGNFHLEIELEKGKNNIQIEAIDNENNSSFQKEIINLSSNIKALKGKKTALVIGNSDYTGLANLGENPINDAKDIANTLKSLGFEVILSLNTDLKSLTNSVREFGRKNKDAQTALFFYAGHGLQVENSNYLVPLGANMSTEEDVNFECISVNTIQTIMESNNPNKLNILILDACRNNPFKTWERGGREGLADMTPQSGTLVAFSTSPGSTASNGAGRNGLYTGELIKQLQKSQRIEDVFIKTRIEVEKKSKGKQSPWELARLRGIYYLKHD